MRLTILQAPGKRLVKRFDADGRKHGYDKAAEFRIERHEVQSFRGWCAFFGEVEQTSDRCVIRGAPGPWASLAHPVYRLLHPQPAYTDRRGRRVTREEVIRAKRQAEIGVSLYPTTYLPMFVEEPTPWVLLDFEGIEFEPDWRQRLPEAAGWLKLRLPDAFADISCWYQATGSAADPSKPDLGGAWVRMRLGFLLSRPLTQEQLEAWLGSVPGLDPVTFRTVQPIYIGRPVFARGLADPIPIRSGVLEGLEEVVQVPDSLPEARRSPRKPCHVPAADELAGSSDGLLECPELDEALSEVSGEAGSCRAGLGRAAWAYIRAVGRPKVDVAALTARLTEEALRHRSRDEVATYRLEALVHWWRARAPAEEDDELPTLPDFGPARADRDAALAELHQEIAQELAEAAERIALRRELDRRQTEAREAAAAPFGDPELLDAAGRRKLKAATALASRKARAEYLAELGLEELPPRAAILHTGAQGSGKTLTVAKRLAGLKGGNVLMLVPTLKKAEELEAEIERQIKLRADAGEPVSMFVKVWRGRLAPPPEGERHPAQGFFDKHGINFNRAPAERMCARPKGLIDDAQRSGCRIRATFCGTCSMRLDCRYLDQLDTIKRHEGRLILVAAHDLMFTPLPFLPDLVVIDESVVGKATRSVEIAPERLLDPEKWGDAAYTTDLVGEATPLIEIAEAVARALAQRGRELAALREAGIDDAALAACQGHLNNQHEAMVDEIAEAGKAGVKDSRLSEMIYHLRAAELRNLALLFSNLKTELGARRDGANGTRLVRGRVKEIKEPDGSTREERLDRYIVSRPRGHGLSSGAELILLDGTGDLELNAYLFGDDLALKRCSVNRQGPAIQVTSTTNSKYQLLARPEADRNRRKIRRLIADLSTALDRSLLVGSTKKLEAKLLEEGALEGVQSMHFGAERGMNSAEHCEAVLVIGREQPQLAALEDLARGFTIASDEPFVSVLDENEKGELRLYRRRRRMRDGSEVWAEVRSHPDPFARALLEQMREAAVAQMGDRVRAIWNPKLIIIGTSVPVDFDVTHLVTQAELMRAAGLATAGKRDADARGWWLAPQRAREAEETGERGGVSVIDILLQFSLALTSFPAVIPSQGNLLRTALWSALPQAGAFRLAAAVHPGLRASPPEGGVLRECLRRHGLLVAWPDLPAAVPELVPDAAALRAVKDAEREQLAELRQGLLAAPYRVAGRRGPAGTVAWDPARIVDPQAALARLLGEGVTVDWQPSPEKEPDFMNPETWAAPAQGVIEDDGEPPPFVFRWGSCPLPPYVLTDLFKIGDRVMAIVSCHPDPSLVMEEAA